MRYSVDAALVEKRAKCINSSYDKPDCGLIYERAMNSIKNNNPNKNNILKFFNECASPSNANKYYRDCLTVINSLDDDKLVKSLKEKYIDSIIPYVDNLSSIEEASNIVDGTFSSNIYNTAKQYEICDRILDNHSKISKRFNVDHFMESKKHSTLDNMVLPMCNMIDTYDLKPHAKMNVCLEEISYLLQKNGVNYKKEDLTKYITEYFLTRSDNTDVDTMNKYRMVLSENSMISDNDLYKVRYFTEMDDDNKSEIVKMLDSFTVSESKSAADFNAIISYVMNNDNKADIINNMKVIFSYIRNYMLTDAFDIGEIVEGVGIIPASIESYMQDDTWVYTRTDLDAIIGAYDIEIANIDEEINTSQDKDLITKLMMLKDAYLNAKARILALSNVVYTEYNIECMNKPYHTFIETMYTDEYRYSFNNLRKASRQVYNDIKSKADKICSESGNRLEYKDNATRFNKPVYNTTLAEALMDDGTVDIVVAEFAILNEDNFYQIHDQMSKLCKSINNTTLYNTDATAYYTVLPDTVQIHLEDVSDLVLTEDEEEEVDAEFLTDDDRERVLMLQTDADAIDSIDDVDKFANLPCDLKTCAKDIDRDIFDGVIEAAQYLGTIELEDIQEMYDVFSESHDGTYTETSHTKNLVDSWKHVDLPLTAQVEAYDIINELLEADNDKKEEKKNEDKQSLGDKIKSKLPQPKSEEEKAKEKEQKAKEKEEKQAAKEKAKEEKDEKRQEKADELVQNAMKKINDLKLYAKGIASKAKDLSAKEKEWSNTLDSEFNRLYKSCTDALTNDRREAIIKGSVIPSFSKCIKFGIAIAGISIINPVAGAVSAIGALIASKKLNKKERLLLMDELEVEMEVVDKEIQMADSRDQTKKMRKLMSYKKDLQRQYQRLKYNVRIGKDLMPNSATGIREH